MQKMGVTLRGLCRESKGTSKYKAQAVEIDGIRFSSQMEAKRYIQLRLLEKTGKIVYLVVHPHWDFEINGVKVGRGYTADFEWYEMGGKRHVEDVKGVTTRDWPLRRDLMKALHGITVSLWPAREKKRRTER